MTSVDCEKEGSCEVSKRDLDVVFDILSATRRRLALQYLSDCQGGWADLAEVVDFVVDQTDHPEHHRESIAIDLTHNHLPRLEDAGFVEFDQRSQSVRYHPDDLVEAWLARAEELRDE